jgi:CARDB/Secretion system C-terminal sorting domain
MNRTLVVFVLVAAFPIIAASAGVQQQQAPMYFNEDGLEYAIRSGVAQLDPADFPVNLKNPAGDVFIQDDTTLTFSEGFEEEFPGLWTLTEGHGNRAWGIDDERVHSGDAALYCNNHGNHRHNKYKSNQMTTIVYGPLDASDFDSGYLNFWHWTKTELDGDFLFAGVSGDGELFQGFYISGMIQEWREQTLDISPYAGGDVYVMFRFVSNKKHNYEGVYLDDISLQCYDMVGAYGETAELTITNINRIPYNPSVGQTVNLTLTIENTGAVHSGDFDLDLFTDQPMPPLAGDGSTHTRNMPMGLAPGQTTTVSFAVDYLDDGTKHLWALIDAGEDVLEHDETDNLYGIYDIPVGVATHVEAEPYFDVELPAEGGSFSYMITVEQFREDAAMEGWISITYQSYGNSIEVYHIPDQLFYEGTPYAYDYSQTVPETAPPGEYRLTVTFGQYPWVVVETGSFTFVKLGEGMDPSPDLGDPSNWPVYGELAGNGNSTDTDLIPSALVLSPAYPNPFNAQAQVQLTLPEADALSLTMYNVQGRQVATIANGRYAAGDHTFNVDARNLASGTYLLHAKSGSGDSTVQKLVLMK